MSRNSQSIKALTPYICGNSGPLDDFNPFFVTKQKWAPELLYLLNKHPLSIVQVSSTLKINQREVSKLLKDLVKIKAVEEKSGVYHVAFSTFTRNDLFIMKQATKPIASKLSHSIGIHKSEIASLVQNFSSIKQVAMGKLLFAALGCFVLDWLGLKILEDEGLLIKSKPQPGNRNYVLFAREKVDPNIAMKLYNKMYWGSNSDKVDKFFFTSFGDYSGIRYAFPDIIWMLQASPKIAHKFDEKSQWLTEKATTLAGLLSRKLLRDVGLLLFRLNSEGPVSAKEFNRDHDKTWTSNLLRLLEDMNYVISEKRMLKLNYPVFAAEDKGVIEQLGNLIIPSVTTTISRNCPVLQRALSDTTPIKNGIAFNEVLTDAWHWIFAQTNKTLAEEGFLYNPPKENAEEARYIAWVSQFGFP